MLTSEQCKELVKELLHKYSMLVIGDENKGAAGAAMALTSVMRAVLNKDYVIDNTLPDKVMKDAALYCEAATEAEIDAALAADREVLAISANSSKEEIEKALRAKYGDNVDVKFLSLEEALKNMPNDGTVH